MVISNLVISLVPYLLHTIEFTTNFYETDVIFLEVGEGRRETLSPVPLKETFRRRFVPFLSKERSERMWIVDTQN